MDKTPRQKRCNGVAAGTLAVSVVVAAVVGAFAGCGGAGAISTATEMPSAARHPDGVVVEPPPALPAVAVRAEARGVVALREPLGPEAARDLVADMIAAIVREDPAALEGLMTAETAYYEAGRRLSRSMLLDRWRARMQQLDYDHLAGVEIVRPEDIQTFEIEDTGGPGEPERPAEMLPGDVYVRAPVTTSRIGTDQFFGDEIDLVLRAQDGHFRIAGYAEQDAD